MIVGCYDLTLYCDNKRVHSGRLFRRSYNDEYGSRCRAEAKRDGWEFNITTGAALCPSCVKDQVNEKRSKRSNL